MRLTYFKCTYIDGRRYSFKKTPNFLNLVSIFRQQIEVRKCVVYNEDIGRYGAWDAVSVQGVESLWGDCRFIPADWGS